jgi:hypothetical protein
MDQAMNRECKQGPVPALNSAGRPIDSKMEIRWLQRPTAL